MARGMDYGFGLWILRRNPRTMRLYVGVGLLEFTGQCGMCEMSNDADTCGDRDDLCGVWGCVGM
jgi:hypothetical protein